MNTSLAHWLTENRDTLLLRWKTLQYEHTHATNPNGNGAVAHSSADPDHQIAHPDEQNILLDSLYDGLICAAEQNYDPLKECLRLVRALRMRPGEDELPQQLALVFYLRRTAWELLFEDAQPPRTKHDSQAWRRLIGACGRVCTRGGDPLLTSPF